MKPKRTFPVTAKAINSQRTRSVTHPWNRGYPNNAKLAEMVKGKKCQE